MVPATIVEGFSGSRSAGHSYAHPSVGPVHVPGVGVHVPAVHVSLITSSQLVLSGASPLHTPQVSSDVLDESLHVPRAAQAVGDPAFVSEHEPAKPGLERNKVNG